MKRRATPNPRPFALLDRRDDARETQEPRFDLHANDVRQRAAQWDATGALLAAAVANRPAGHDTSEPQARPIRATAQNQRTRRAGAARSAAHQSDGAAGNASNESWQDRQLVLLERIDDNLRRLRELQESARSPLSVFTEPAS